MSLKQDVDNIKKEFSAEESYIEKVFKFEKFFKKYKMIIITLVIAIIFATIAYYVSDHFAQKNKLQANQAFNTLLQNPNDKEALAILEVKNPTTSIMKQIQMLSFLKSLLYILKPSIKKI